MEPITSKIPLMVIEGNHEIEPQGHGGEVTFASYLARFAVPSEESGSNTKFYYSFNAGGIHFIMLGAYVDYNRTGNNSFTTISFPFDFCSIKYTHTSNVLSDPMEGSSRLLLSADNVTFCYVHCLQELSTYGWRRICRGLIAELPLGLSLLGIHLGITATLLTTRNSSA